MKSFTVGVVGAGQIVRDVHMPVLVGLPNARVVWITDAAPERARAVGDAYGVPVVPGATSPETLPAADVVLLGIPAQVREAYFRTLAARGTAVLAEKPFAIGERDHERFAALFPDHRIGCGYMRRFYRGTTILRRTVIAGPFGALRAVRITEGGRAARTGFDATYQDLPSADGGGVLWAIGCHMLDLVAFVTGASEFEVLERDVVIDDRTDREVSATIRLAGSELGGPESVRLDFRVSWLGPQDDRIELTFGRATVVAGLRPDSAVVAHLGDGSRLALDLDSDDVAAATTLYQAFHLEWADFLRGVERGQPSRVGASTSLLTTRMIDALLASGAA